MEGVNWSIESIKDELQQTNQLIALNHLEARQEQESAQAKIEKQ